MCLRSEIARFGNRFGSCQAQATFAAPKTRIDRHILALKLSLRRVDEVATYREFIQEEAFQEYEEQKEAGELDDLTKLLSAAIVGRVARALAQGVDDPHATEPMPSAPVDGSWRATAIAAALELEWTDS